MLKVYIKRYITDVIILTGLYTFLKELWDSLEWIFDGGIQVSISDSIIATILTLLLGIEIRKWISIRADGYSD